MSPTEAQIYVYPDPKIKESVEVPSKYKDWIVIGKGDTHNAGKVKVRLTVSHTGEFGGRTYHNQPEDISITLYSCYVIEQEEPGKEDRRSQSTECGIGLDRFIGNSDRVPQNVFYDLSKEYEKEKESDKENLPKAKYITTPKYQLSLEHEGEHYAVKAYALLLSDDRLYDIMSKYLTFLRKSGARIESVADGPYVVIAEKENAAEPLKLAVDTAKKILDTPDETDKFLPKVDFSMNACLKLFDATSCSKALSEKILELYKKSKSNFVIDNISITEEDFGFGVHYIAKIDDGICELAYPLSNLHEVDTTKYTYLSCITKSRPQS